MPRSWRVTAAALLFASTAGHAQDLIGEPSQRVTVADDTLLDLAREAGVGYNAIRIANPGIDPWLPGAGQVVLLPTQHVLPAAPRRGIVINLPELRLYFFPAGGGAPRSYPVSIGDEGTETPVGRTTVVRKRRNPSWTPPPSIRAANPDLPAVVPPGPDNPMGEYALDLGWRSFVIHGTNRPYSIGRRGSHGCIRLYPEHIARLHAEAAIGTPVTVLDQRAKLGWLGHQLYLEVHPHTRDANRIEAEGRRQDERAYDVRDLVAVAVGAELERVDWEAVFDAGLEQSGMPVPVLRNRRPLRLKLDLGQY